jgi:chromosome segregation ATPase
MNPIELLKKLIATIASLLATHRTEDERIAQIRSEYQAEIDELKRQLADDSIEESEVNDLIAQLDELLVNAAAAKPPVDVHIEEVKAKLAGADPVPVATTEHPESSDPGEPSDDVKF